MVAGCSLFSDNTAAELWTDRPELAVCAELYNAETTGRKIEIVYKETPWLALERESGQPALVAGTRLDSVSAIKNFQSFETTIRKGMIDPSRFYKELFDMGCYDEKCLLLPVSFTLPAVTFKAELGEVLSDSYTIGYEEMRSRSADFNIFDERPTHLGYSPRWQPDFLYFLTRLLGADYYESNGGLTMWNDTKVQEALSYASDWIATVNSGYASEEAFESKYMYDPMYKLLDTKRILFNVIMIDQFMSVPTEVRKNLDFRWLSDGIKKIPVQDDVLFIGLPKQSKHKKTAEDFVSWLFRYETQVKLLESAQFERMRFFGIAGGLSSLIAVNMDAIPRFFPFMLGHIPDSSFLDFPERLPKSWERMRAEVIIPWLAEAISETGNPVSLADNLSQWRLRQPDLYR
jgi:ABC-type glycerol-3-phosphate transport system substrate-binding protein